MGFGRNNFLIIGLLSLAATGCGGGSSKSSEDGASTDPVLLAPVISFSASAYSLLEGQLLSPIVPSNSGGVIESCVSSPALPTGLSLGSTNCEISGTPTPITAAASYTITASNSAGQGSAVISIEVLEVAPDLSYSGSPFVFTKGTAVGNINPSNAGSAVTSCSSIPLLPAGLTLSSSCKISGTPTTVSSATSYLITGVNGAGSDSVAISIAVNDVAPTLAYSDPYIFTKDQAITAQTPTNSGGAIVSCSSSPALPSGLSLSSSDCTISGTPTSLSAAASYVITASNSGGSASDTISIEVLDVPPSIAYAGSPYSFNKDQAITAQTPTNSGGAITSCSSSPALPAGLSLGSTDCQISGTPTVGSAATAYTITATNTGGSGTTNISIAIVEVAPALSYSPSSFSFLLRDSVSAITPSNSGGTPGSCSSSPALPSGLTLSSQCVISGTATPVTAATSYTITGTNSAGSSSATISITIASQMQIAFYSMTDVAGTMNGTAAGSQNIWKASLDGVDRLAITANTNTGLNSIFPVFNPAGTALAYSSLRDATGLTNGTPDGAHNIWSSAVDASVHTRLTANGAARDTRELVFSPDGTKIAYITKQPVQGGAPASSYNLFIMSADGSAQTKLTANKNAGLDSYSPVFSPDGTTIYFSSLHDLSGASNGTPSNSFNIWKVNVNGTGLTPLTSFNSTAINAVEPAVSPDGSTVYYASTQNVGASVSSSYNVFSMSAVDGSAQTALTTQTAAGRDSIQPNVSTDGTEIVFASRMDVSGVPSSSYNLWKMASSGASQVALTANTAASLDSENPSFSPDDQKIVFASRQDVGGVASASYNIWVINSDGTGTPVPVTSNTAASLDSRLAARGVWLVP